jgi:diguanylate cyclase (GGDEF)-like protein
MYLCYLDINRFKDINDIYGHGVGDEVIKHFAILIRCEMKETQIVCRLFRCGGDEFIMLIDTTQMNNVVDILKRLDNRIATSPFKLTDPSIKPNRPIPNEGLPISAACGAASTERLQVLGLRPDNILTSWVNLSDTLMYFSKNLIKEGFIEFGPGVAITVLEHAWDYLEKINKAEATIESVVKDYLDTYHSHFLSNFRRKK